LVGLVRRLFTTFRWSVLPVPGRLIAVIFFAALFIIPLTITIPRYHLLILTFTTIFAMFAVSWDFLSGYTGQVNFGHALFFGVGAYCSALLNKYLGWQPGLTIPIGAVVAMLAGVATCFPALRLRGPYLSLLTMAFPLMLLGLVIALKDYTGGEYGIMVPHIAATGLSQYYICLIVMTVAVLIMWKLTDAGSKYVRTGLIFHAIREDEIAARASGINTIRYKLLAFTIGGLFAGIAGTLYVHVLGVAGPSTLVLTMSFQAVIWVAFGGIVSIYGPIVGVIVLYTLLHFLGVGGTTFIGRNQILIMSVVVILMLLFMPQGVAVWVRNKIERECPRCKLANGAWRKECRACGANLR